MCFTSPYIDTYYVINAMIYKHLGMFAECFSAVRVRYMMHNVHDASFICVSCEATVSERLLGTG